MELTRSHLERLSAQIARRSGMAFPEHRWPFLRCRVRSAMARARSGRAPVLRQRVRFVHQDIQEASTLGRFDAVFCCNVLLYCTADAKRRIVERFAASLHRGGRLFLGHAEGITPPAAWFTSAPLPARFVYQRV